jgi:predicted ABC-type ATPase
MSKHSHTVDGQSAAEAIRKHPRQWVDPDSVYSECEVSPAEYDAALAAARKDLLGKKKPVPAGTAPHLLITIGAPGAGKSTVSEAVAAERGSGDYVTIDMDVAVKYHPRYRDIWAAPNAVTGRATEVGFTLSYLECNSLLEDILIRIYDDVVFGEGARYNVILQSHAHINIILAKLAGYRVTLLFVGVPLEIAKARSRTRAVETGKFLAANLAIQDQVVESMWVDYRKTAAWYGLWADEFLVADNRRKAKSDGDARRAVLRYVKEIPLHCKDWNTCRQNAQDAIDAACTP